MALIAFLSVTEVLCAEESASPTIDFDKQIRPIFARACDNCHSPELTMPTADLPLRADALLRRREDKPALIAPENPDESELLRRITSADAKIRMPPEDVGPALSSEQITLIRAWIQQQVTAPSNTGSVRVKQRDQKPRVPSDTLLPAAKSSRVEAIHTPPSMPPKTTVAAKQPRSLGSTGIRNPAMASAAAPFFASAFQAAVTLLPRPPLTENRLYEWMIAERPYWPISSAPRIADYTPMAALTLPQEVARSVSLGFVSPVAAKDEVQLTLPPIGYAVVGAPIGVEFDNLILSENPAAYQFVVTCDIGMASAQRWSLTADASDIGDHFWQVDVWKDQAWIAQRTMTWRVTAADAGHHDSLSLLIIGDSLTHATEYPNDLARRLSLPGQPQWKMIGTHHTAVASPGVVHEGYGGWTWDAFLRRYRPELDPATGKNVSPFVFTQGGSPQLDVARYFEESADGSIPDVIFVLLGINDCFSINPDDERGREAVMDNVFATAETLIAEFRRAAPRAEIGIGLTTPPNARSEAFIANYGERMTRWRWKRIQHRFVQRQIEHFANREGEGLFIVPTELNLDPAAGFPERNAVHPNTFGYQQIAASVHAWLSARWHAE